MTLKQHFAELKTRLLYILLFFFLFSAASYLYSEDIYRFLLTPLQNIYHTESKHQIIYTNLTEAFFTYIKLATFCGFIATIPMVSWQIYHFIKPGLKPDEITLAKLILSLAPILFFCGASLVFFFVIPKAWHFFISFESNIDQNLPIILQAKISEYLSLIIHLITAFGVAFQMPVVILLLTMLKLFNSKIKSKKKIKKLHI